MRIDPTTGAVSCSPSELKDADMCLRKYYYGYFLRIEGRKICKSYLALGIVMHEVLEAALQNKPMDTVVADAWAKLKKEYPGDAWKVAEDLGSITEGLYLARVNQLAHQIVAYWKNQNVLGTEIPLTYDFDKFYKIHGYIDVVHRNTDSKLCLVDWKFGNQAKTLSSVIEYWHQFTGYRLMAMQKFGEEPLVHMHTGAASTAMKPKADYKYDIIPAQLPYEKTSKELFDRIRQLADHNFRALDEGTPEWRYPQTGRANGVCGYCDYALLCDGVAKVEDFPKKTDKRQKGK